MVYFKFNTFSATFTHITFILKLFVKFDWMHDTARCFEYPSDSSRTARKRAGTLGWAGPRHWQAPPSPALGESATSTAPARAHCAHSPTGGVGRCLQAEGHGCLLGCLGPRRIAGMIATSAPQGEAVGRGPGRSCRGWIAISVVCGVVGLWGRTCHWHVCWAGS
jgi:hypothetical protein